MKSEVEYKKYDLPHFLIQIKELIDEQEKEVKRAVLSIGSAFERRHLSFGYQTTA